MSVRRATPADRANIVRLLKDAHAASLSDQMPFSAPHAHALACRHDSAPDMLSLVYAPKNTALGVLLASAQDHPFTSARYAMETVWWIAPDARGRVAHDMLDAYEAWAAAQGCVFCQMVALVSFPKAERIYLRRGYRCVETHFLKPLTD